MEALRIRITAVQVIIAPRPTFGLGPPTDTQTVVNQALAKATDRMLDVQLDLRKVSHCDRKVQPLLRALREGIGEQKLYLKLRNVELNDEAIEDLCNLFRRGRIHFLDLKETNLTSGQLTALTTAAPGFRIWR